LSRRGRSRGSNRLHLAFRSTATAGFQATDEPAAIEEASGLPIWHKGEASVEALISEDIQTASTTVSYGQKKGGTEWKLSLSYSSIDEDYELADASAVATAG